MIRLQSVFRRGGGGMKCCSLTASYFNRYYCSNKSQDECKKKQVSCLGTPPADAPKCPKKAEEVCQQGTMKLPPLPPDCKSGNVSPPVYDSSCMRPYVSPCQMKGTCQSDLVPRPCVAPCERKAKVCLGEPDCAFERRIDWGLHVRQVLLGLGAFVGGLILWRIYGQEVSVEVHTLKKDRRFNRPLEIHKVPESSSDIPSQIDYLIIGGGTAGWAAQKAIRVHDKKAKILMVSEAPPFKPSMRPPLSGWLWKEKDREKALSLQFRAGDKKYVSLMFEQDSYYTPVPNLETLEGGGVGVAQGWTVEQIFPQRKTVKLTDGKRIQYSKCLLATGGTPKVQPPFTEAEADVLQKVTFYRNSFDFQELEELIQEGMRCIAVVGGGILGTELCAALKERTKAEGVKIVNIVKDAGNMQKMLPSYLAKKITEVLTQRGVNVMTETHVEDVAKDGSNVKLYVTNDKCVTADHVIVATGIEPNTKLAEGCVETDPVNGGFMVNYEMQASTGLYAAGDCASYYDCALGRRRQEHHSYALATGKIAGENMTGKMNRMVLEPAFWFVLSPDYEMQGTGIVDAKYPSVGIFPKSLPAVVEEEEDEEEEPPELEALSNPIELSDGGDTAEGDFDRVDSNAEDLETTLANQPFDRGIVYYLNDKQQIIGVLTINLPGKIHIGQSVVKANKTYEDIDEITKEFDMHNVPPPSKNMGKKHNKGRTKTAKELL